MAIGGATMSLAKYRYILTIAEQRSFSKAAETLFVSQPYLSKLVKNIEEELGAEIFDRSSSPLSLTPAGKCYVEYIKELLYSKQKLKFRIGEIAKHHAGRLIVGIPQTLGSYLLPYTLENFRKLYPKFEIIVQELSNQQLLERVLNNSLDLCCIGFPKIPNEIDYVVLKQEKIVMVLPPNHPLGDEKAKGKIINPYPFPVDRMKQLSHEKFILLTQSQGMGSVSRQVFQKYDITPDVFMETRNIETAYRLAASGIAITFTPEVCMLYFRYDDEPYYYTIGVPPLQRSVVMAFKRGRLLSNTEKDFINFTKAAICDFEKRHIMDTDIPKKGTALS